VGASSIPGSDRVVNFGQVVCALLSAVIASVCNLALSPFHTDSEWQARPLTGSILPCYAHTGSRISPR
jgi:hypothetical protein